MTDFMSQIKDADKQKKLNQRIASLAMGEAFKWSFVTGIISTGATVLATMKSKNFSKFMSVSAKVSLPTMATVGMFGYRYEIVHYDSMMNPGKWGLVEYVEQGRPKDYSSMPIHHRAANYMYDHPFYFVAGLGFPFAGAVLRSQLGLGHLTLSQKIMHSRVYAQAGVLTILLVTMGFREYMDRRGRFPEPKGDDEQEEEEKRLEKIPLQER
mmetsp:Transcript_5374/g.8766  ORF Transcript_5374/g.8766 Transcript_5374/m.8766 type:complete len:211 (+) Transcript_5374:61-693(+)